MNPPKHPIVLTGNKVRTNEINSIDAENTMTFWLNRNPTLKWLLRRLPGEYQVQFMNYSPEINFDEVTNKTCKAELIAVAFISLPEDDDEDF